MKQTSDICFKPNWLSLREPADHAARDKGLLSRAAACVPDNGLVLDLGSGTGSTARAFDGAGMTHTRWRFFDQDPALLKVAKAQTPSAEYYIGDISDVDGLPLDGVSLITASALFDLMSERWLEALLATADRMDLPIYAALNYNGEMSWTPSDARDRHITEAFNSHQLKDKGTGPALGPGSGLALHRLAKTREWDVSVAESPWQLGDQDIELHKKLVDGIAEAAHNAGATHAFAWREDRRSTANKSSARIGHFDVLAIPASHKHKARGGSERSHAIN